MGNVQCACGSTHGRTQEKIAAASILWKFPYGFEEVTLRGSTAAKGLVNGLVEDHQGHNEIFGYDAAGSGAGQDFVSSGEGVLGFGDVPFTEKPEDVVQMPFAVGAMAVYANFGDAVISQGMNAKKLCEIFSGKVAAWSDISASLPNTPPVLVVRSDSSGSTEIFTKFLSEACGDSWTNGSGKDIKWGTKVTAVEGTEGVIKAISATEGAIGYAVCGSDHESGAVAEVAVVTNADEPATCGDGSIEKVDVSSGQIDQANLGDDSVFPMPFLLNAYMPSDVTESGEAGIASKDFMKHMLTEDQNDLGDHSFFKVPASVLASSVQALEGITTS